MSSRLTVRARDAWLMVQAAVSAEAPNAAAVFADVAMEHSQWRFLPGLEFKGDQVYYSTLMPIGWAYVEADNDARRLLVHAEAGPLVSDWVHLGPLIDVALELGPGLVRLDQALAEMLIFAMTPPDDLSSLTG